MATAAGEGPRLSLLARAWLDRVVDATRDHLVRNGRTVLLEQNDILVQLDWAFLHALEAHTAH